MIRRRMKVLTEVNKQTQFKEEQIDVRGRSPRRSVLSIQDRMEDVQECLHELLKQYPSMVEQDEERANLNKKLDTGYRSDVRN